MYSYSFTQYVDSLAPSNECVSNIGFNFQGDSNVYFLEYFANKDPPLKLGKATTTNMKEGMVVQTHKHTRIHEGDLLWLVTLGPVQ